MFNTKTKAPLPMMTRDSSNGSGEEIATNFFTLNQKDYLLICDTFSKYPFLFEITKKTAEMTIPKFQQLFTQYGPAEHVLQTVDSHFIIKNYNLHDATTTHYNIPTLPSVKQIHCMMHQNH